MKLGRRNSTQSPPPPPPPASINSTDQQHNDDYSKSKPQWSFTLSRTIKKPIDIVIGKLGGLDNFERWMLVNPVCLEYKEIGRDWVGPVGSECGLENARVREMSPIEEEDLGGLSLDEEERGKLYYRRVMFESKDSVVAFCGLVSDVTEQWGTFVWDGEGRVGVWEVRAVNPAGREDIDSWARMVIRFREKDGGTKIEQFVEGYSKEKYRFLEGVTKRFTRDLHKNWMKRYSDVFKD